jgi:exodeoxyribonuclease VIII
MKPELIHNLPFGEYNAIEAERKSTLTAMATSPGAYRLRCDTEFKTTPDMDFGDAVDTLLFEGKDALMGRFAMRPEGLKLTTKEGKAWKRDNPGIVVPAHEVYSTALAVLMDPVAADILAAGEFQVSAFAQDEDSGLWCKVRPDICRRTYKPTDVRTLADLKVTGVFELHAWTRIAYRLKYHWQAAMYCDVMTAATGNYHEHFFFIVAENKPPHHVAVRKCPASVIEQGRADYKAALRKVRECREADYWPTSTGEVQAMELERWMR